MIYNRGDGQMGVRPIHPADAPIQHPPPFTRKELKEKKKDTLKAMCKTYGIKYGKKDVKDKLMEQLLSVAAVIEISSDGDAEEKEEVTPEGIPYVYISVIPWIVSKIYWIVSYISMFVHIYIPYILFIYKNYILYTYINKYK